MRTTTRSNRMVTRQGTRLKGGHPTPPCFDRAWPTTNNNNNNYSHQQAATNKNAASPRGDPPFIKNPSVPPDLPKFDSRSSVAEPVTENNLIKAMPSLSNPKRHQSGSIITTP